jgi:hypothetical protein
MPEARVKVLQRFAAKGAVIGILPDSARERFAGCPGLPAAPAPAP